jgi:hypothetical protein
MTTRHLIEQLKRQLGFLTRSCESFDQGFSDEAIRIAVIVRTLIHDTRNTTSLLSRLGKSQIDLLSTSPVVPEEMIFFGGGLSSMEGRMEGGKLTAKYVPNLGRTTRRHRLIPLEIWWKEPVYAMVGGLRIARSDIVLNAANKDGGCHVDPNLTPEYTVLRDGFMTFHQEKDGVASEKKSIGESHFSDLRQMGYELLQSPGLLSLTR